MRSGRSITETQQQALQGRAEAVMIGHASVAPRAVGLLAAAGTILATGIAFMPPSLPWSAPLHVRVEAGDFGEINSGAWVELRGA